MIPGMPSRTTAQSYPGPRLRRDSQPSIHLPWSVYLSGANTGSAALMRFSFSAKKSSLAARTQPPARSPARSSRSVKELELMPPQDSPRRRVVGINVAPAQDRLVHDARKLAARVRRQFVPLPEPAWVDGELGLGIPEGEVGVEPQGDRAFASRQSREFRGPVRHPASDVVHLSAALPGFRPDRRKPEFERGDSAPGSPEAARRFALQCRMTRRVVGNHEVDLAAAEGAPERLPVGALADGRSALEFRCVVGDGFRLEHQIVRA